MLFLVSDGTSDCPDLQDSSCSSVNSLKGSLNMEGKEDALLPEIAPADSPQPFLPLLAPSPWAPFINSTLPKLSGLVQYLIMIISYA